MELPYTQHQISPTRRQSHVGAQQDPCPPKNAHLGLPADYTKLGPAGQHQIYSFNGPMNISHPFLFALPGLSQRYPMAPHWGDVGFSAVPSLQLPKFFKDPQQEEATRYNSPAYSANSSKTVSSSSSALFSTQFLGPYVPQSSADSIQSKAKPAKSDHAFLGEICDTNLIEIAKKNIQTPFDELAHSVKLAETNLARIIGSSSKHSRDNRHAEAHKKKQHQILAMVFLIKRVQIKDSAVCPRNRIFNQYVQLCQQYGVQPVVNASFGKLVKALFPGIKTRRLGIRGSSRYHYCGIKLVGDADEVESLASTTSTTPTTGSPAAAQANEMSPDTQFDLSLEDNFLNRMTIEEPDLGISNIGSILHFFDSAEQKELKEIENYYAAHCRNVLHCIRFMKIKTLFESMSSDFSGLSMHAKSLLSSPHVISWILRCDNSLYIACIRLLSKMIFQNVPEPVCVQMTRLNTYFMKYVKEMMLPNDLIQAKLPGAETFVKMTSRLTRVMLAGHNCVRNLCQPSVVLELLQDWEALDVREIVKREIRCQKLEEIIDVLQHDITNVFREVSALTLHSQETEDTIIQTLSTRMSRIPEKFVDVSPQTFLLISNQLADSIMRQLTLDNHNHIVVWWGLSCWLNEFFIFLAELGGYNKLVADYESPRE
ncbi:hypothetical protein KL937_000306 [Ogataea polymorpha]|nr:hypothetical protein KL937_000306 [Ogataea polymorpha]KAG7895820.1 hypothetical protein KL936_000528 [Ogataea polymorpha]KAG7940378.1 hypothetical protein KL904_000241 [Ogataea polymorpha]